MSILSQRPETTRSEVIAAQAAGITAGLDARHKKLGIPFEEICGIFVPPYTEAIEKKLNVKSDVPPPEFVQKAIEKLSTEV